MIAQSLKRKDAPKHAITAVRVAIFHATVLNLKKKEMKGEATGNLVPSHATTVNKQATWLMNAPILEWNVRGVIHLTNLVKDATTHHTKLAPLRRKNILQVVMMKNPISTTFDC